MCYRRRMAVDIRHHMANPPPPFEPLDEETVKREVAERWKGYVARMTIKGTIERRADKGDGS